MKIDRFIVGTPLAADENRDSAPARSGWLRRYLSYWRLVGELERLPAPLLADIGLRPSEIRAFARAAVDGTDLRRHHRSPPVTSIGSPIWNRAMMLRGGNR